MKLSKRLKHIEQMIDSDYDHIWDCCCDHGFLGTSLLTKKIAKNIHFVDIVPELITTIESKLACFHPDLEANWSAHCLDVANLPLEKYQGKHLIIIAGIGSDLMIRMIDDIYQKRSNLEIEFLLCPVNRQFALREKLINLNFSLKDEILIEDKSRIYEILLVSAEPNKYSKVSPVGEKIWHNDNDKQAKVANEYLNKILNYYQGIQKSDAKDVERIIAEYKKMIL